MVATASPISRTWKALFIEPFYWFRVCFVNPSKFRAEIEVDDSPSLFDLNRLRATFWKRLMVMLRMFIFLLVLSYLCAIVLRFLFLLWFPGAFNSYLPSSQLALIPSLWDALKAVLIALVLLTLVGAILGPAVGIAFGFAGGIWAGVFTGSIWVGEVGRPAPYSGTSIFMLGLVYFILVMIFGIANSRATDARLRTFAGTIGSLLGGILSLVLGIPAGLLGGYVGGSLMRSWHSSLLGGMLGATLGLVCGVVLASVIEGMVRGTLRKKHLNVVLERAISVGRIFCVAAGGITGGAVGTYIISGSDSPSFGAVFTGDIFQYFPIVFIAICLGFILGFSRWPLYPYSSVAMLRSYRASRKEPLKVFDFLHRSALYWNEFVPLPLPGLKYMLQQGAILDEERMLDEINFIVMERPSQIVVAQAVMLENTLERLEECDNLDLIGKASLRLGKILPGESGLIDARWVKPLAALNDACRSAVNYRYRTPYTRQARIDALKELIEDLQRVHPEAIFENLALSKRLSVIVRRWQTLAKQELERVEESSRGVDSIDNPYVCGPALKANNPLFVGRRDLVQRLEQALHKDAHRPCFFLTGERRMGKTSTLNQLPELLGSRYLPIIFDLQARGISASAHAFLAEIADVICRTMDARGIRIHRKLRLANLRELSRENEAEAYRIFDEWFRGVETLLEKENRTLLLAFDEFEKLEEASAARFLDLSLLLDWFRSVMQNHARLALLFSGVRTPQEMGSNWSGHFVNVKTQKVGLLSTTDAYRLITEPVSDYPGEEIFGKEVVDEIMRMTGCHPFLIQAVCSELIEIMNADNRKQACLPDVASAASEVLQSWWDTYFRDLWERTGKEERLCLSALRRLREATLEEIMQQSNIDLRATAKAALERLQRRDLVLVKGDCYNIVAPIFDRWVELNLE